jgi:hypothetical protein
MRSLSLRAASTCLSNPWLGTKHDDERFKVAGVLIVLYFAHAHKKRSSQSSAA